MSRVLIVIDMQNDFVTDILEAKKHGSMYLMCRLKSKNMRMRNRIF